MQEAAAAAAPGARDVQSHRYAGFDDGDDDEEPAPAPDLQDEEDEAGQHISAASLVRTRLRMLDPKALGPGLPGTEDEAGQGTPQSCNRVECTTHQAHGKSVLPSLIAVEAS